MYRTLTFLLLAITPFAYSQERIPYLRPSAHLQRLLDVETLTPNYCKTDYMISGAHPLLISHTYAPIASRVPSKLEVCRETIWVWMGRKHSSIDIYLQEASGRILQFEAPKGWVKSRHKRKSWEVGLKKGSDDRYISCARTQSGQTDPQNIRLQYSEQYDAPTIVYTDGSGERRVYKCHAPCSHRQRRKGDCQDLYRLERVTRPNGTHLHYRYRHNQLERIELRSAEQTHVMAWAAFSKGVPNGWTIGNGWTIALRGQHLTSVTTSDQRTITYCVDDHETTIAQASGSERLPFGHCQKPLATLEDSLSQDQKPYLKARSGQWHVAFAESDCRTFRGESAYQFSLSSDEESLSLGKIRHRPNSHNYKIDLGETGRFSYSGKDLCHVAYRGHGEVFWLWDDGRVKQHYFTENSGKGVDHCQRLRMLRSFIYDRFGNITKEILHDRLTRIDVPDLPPPIFLPPPSERGAVNRVVNEYDPRDVRLEVREVIGNVTKICNYHGHSKVLESVFTVIDGKIVARKFYKHKLTPEYWDRVRKEQELLGAEYSYDKLKQEVLEQAEENNYLLTTSYLVDDGATTSCKDRRDVTERILTKWNWEYYGGVWRNESTATLRTYSTNGFNLLLEETTGRITKKYTYKEGTNLLLSLLTLADGHIESREFYQYDECAVVTEHIVDDGSSADPHDLSDVTVRRITRYTPRYECPAFGLPERIQELYWDPILQKEVLERTTLLTYTEHGQVASREINGALTTYEYDEAGRLIQQCNPHGIASHFTYDDCGNCIQTQIDGCEGATTASYDLAGRLLSKTLPNGLTWQYEYDEEGVVVCETDPRGHKTHWPNGRQAAVAPKTGPPIRDGQGGWVTPTTTDHFDPLGNKTQVHCADGSITKHDYSSRCQPILTTYPDGTTEAWIYTLWGHPVQHTSREGAVTSYECDVLGNILSETTRSPSGELLAHSTHTYKGKLRIATVDAYGVQTQFQYDGAGRLVEERRNGRRVTYAYDAFDHKICEQLHTDQGTLSSYWAYDDLGQLTATWKEDATGRTLEHTQYEYDAKGQCIREEVLDPESTLVIERQYDCLGQVIFERQNDQETAILYDHFYELDGQTVLRTVTTDSLGSQIEEIFDPAGYLDCLRHRDPDGSILSETHYLYDTDGRKVQESHGEVITQWVYGPMGRLEQLIEDGGKRITLYEYDETGQQRAVIKPDGTRIETHYDCLGRLIQHSGPDYCYGYQYDLLGRITAAGDTHYEYDADDNVVTETHDHGLCLHYQYDSVGRPLNLTLPDGSEVSYEWDTHFLREIRRNGYCHHYHAYNDRGQLTSGQLGNGLSYHLGFDPHNRCEQIQSAPFSCLAAYDTVGNLTNLTTTDPLGPLDWEFTHDSRHQLTSETGLEAHTYAYDPLGNRIQCDDNTALFDGLNQEIAPHLTWDENGCLIAQDEVTYQYDSLDRLIRMEGPLIALEMTYDYKHRRLSRTLYHRASSDAPFSKLAHLRFFYQGETEIGSVDDTDTIVELRVLGMGQSGSLGSAVMIELEGTPYFPLHDHRGSVVMLLDVDQSVAEYYRYRAFGSHETHGTIGNPWRFASKRTDFTTGLVYFGRRYYDPHATRWLTPDPIGYEAGPNRYTYCHNAPLTRTDYRGYMDFHININFNSGGGHRRGSTISLDDMLIPNDRAAYNEFVWSTLETKKTSKYHLWEAYQSTQYGPGIYDLKCMGRVDRPNHIYAYINGMACSLGDALKQTQTLSDCLGGPNVYLIYNDTRGVAYDFCECHDNIGGSWTEPTHNLYRFWNAKFDENPLLRIVQASFSHGSIHLRNGAGRLDPERQQRMYVANFGPAVVIPKEYCFASMQVASMRDPIWCLGIIGSLADTVCSPSTSFFSNPVQFLKPHPDARFFDHYFDSPTYAEARKFQFKNFLKEFDLL